MNKKYNLNTTNDLPFDTYTDSEIKIVKDETTKVETEREKRHKERIKERLSDASKRQAGENSEALSSRRMDAESQYLEELKQINSENLKHHRAQSKRNRVVIVMLIVMLIIAIAFVSIYAALIKLQNNCHIYSHGDASVAFYVDGEELSLFRSPTTIQGNTVFTFDLDMKIKSSGEYDVKFTILIYQNNNLIENTFAYDYNHDLFYSGSDGYYYSYESYPLSKNSGNGGMIDLCYGVAIDSNDVDLNINNFKMEIHVYLEKV